MISLTRIDARLIHGQVAAIWLKFLNADTIIAVSDIVAKDPFMKELYTCAVPDPNIEVLICTTDEAVALYHKYPRIHTTNSRMIYGNCVSLPRIWSIT